MKHTYILKPFKKNPNDEIKKRKSIEEKSGSMTDKQWKRYLEMESMNTSRK